MENLSDYYSKLLGLESPWGVGHIDLDFEGKRVEIKLVRETGVNVSCPGCSEQCTVYDHAPQRNWCHLDTMGFTTELVADVPRADCAEWCGKRTERVPWAEKNSRFTLLFEEFALQVIGACSCVKSAGKLLGTGWDATHRIMERGVQRGMTRREPEKIKRAGMDEKNMSKGHSYISLLNDLDKGHVIEVVEGRKEENADKLWEGLGEEACKNIKAISPSTCGPPSSVAPARTCLERTSYTTASISARTSTKRSTRFGVRKTNSSAHSGRTP